MTFMTHRDIRLDDDQPEDADKKGEDKPPGAGDPLTAKLLKSRTVLLFGEINEKSARSTVAQLMALGLDEEEPIRLLISSPGGHIESGDAIHDAIRFVKAPVKVIGTGWVASAGITIFLAAAKENRYSLPNTRYMIHQPWGGVRGRASDIEIEAKEILRARERINRLIAHESGQPLDKVAEDTDRNFWMSSDEAKDYGIVTHIIDNAAALD